MTQPNYYSLCYLGTTILLFLWSGSLFAADDCQAFDDNLVSHYTFDRKQSNSLADRTDNQSISASDFIVGAGKIKKGVVFHGKSRLSLGTYNPDFSNGMTISLWVYPKSNANSQARFISKAIGAEADMHYLMAGMYDGNALQFQLRTNNQTDTLISPGELLRVNRWNFVNFVYDLQTMQIYLDGKLVADTEKTGAITTNTAVEMAIGNQPEGAGDKPFIGKMDDLRFYNGALNESEINELRWHRPAECDDKIIVRITKTVTAALSPPESSQGNYQPPSFQETSFPQPMNEQPVYQQPAYQEPVYQEPPYQPELALGGQYYPPPEEGRYLDTPMQEGGFQAPPYQDALDQKQQYQEQLFQEQMYQQQQYQEQLYQEEMYQQQQYQEEMYQQQLYEEQLYQEQLYQEQLFQQEQNQELMYQDTLNQ